MPVPAFATALNYFDGFRAGRLPANLLQAQRDYFGAHTYERTDKPRGKFFHTNWTGRGGHDLGVDVYGLDGPFTRPARPILVNGPSPRPFVRSFLLSFVSLLSVSGEPHGEPAPSSRNRPQAGSSQPGR